MQQSFERAFVRDLLKTAQYLPRTTNLWIERDLKKLTSGSVADFAIDCDGVRLIIEVKAAFAEPRGFDLDSYCQHGISTTLREAADQIRSTRDLLRRHSQNGVAREIEIILLTSSPPFANSPRFRAAVFPDNTNPPLILSSGEWEEICYRLHAFNGSFADLIDLYSTLPYNSTGDFAHAMSSTVPYAYSVIPSAEVDEVFSHIRSRLAVGFQEQLLL
mgnify:CR=1 FL=1